VLRADGTHCSPGEEGEIYHVGAGTFDCYWEDPEKTDEVLVSIRPDERGEVKAVRTGDFGYFDKEGLLYLVGRKDRIAKCMGVRISLAEIEDEIYATEVLKEVAVTAVPHDMFGSLIIAHIVPKSEDAALEKKVLLKKLRKVLRETLSIYMMPRTFLLHEALPRTSSRKVDYPALREIDMEA
jgi:acyl-coenzyme A synthetase/AMP-(fatty) acid ligase